MITIYICSICQCPSLTVYGPMRQVTCIKCTGRPGATNGDAMGDKRIKVIMPGGREFEMAVVEQQVSINKSDDVEVAVNGEKFVQHAVLVGARRKIRE